MVADGSRPKLASARLPLVLQGQVTIGQDPDRVFNYVADLENYPRWFPGIGKMKARDAAPPGTVGKRYDEVAYLPGANIKSIAVEIVESGPGRTLAMDASLDPVLPRFDYEVKPDGKGGAIFRWRCRRRGRGIKAALGQRLMRYALAPRLKKALNDLKSRLEARPGSLMRASVMRRFGPAHEVIEFDAAFPRPDPGPRQVIVRMDASSLNRIDVARRAGYGRVLLDVRGASGFPLILGHDVCGEVVDCGSKVEGLAAGDRVFGALSPTTMGAFADYVAIDARQVIKSPVGVPDEWLGSTPYTFLTAWSALVRCGGLSRNNAPESRIFVQGGAGGVGSMAVQLAKAWGAHVAISCRNRALPHARALGADIVVDVTKVDFRHMTSDYDIALCAGDAGQETQISSLLKKGSGATYVTVIHPTIALGDQHGVVAGPLMARKQKASLDRAFKADGRRIAWATFKPDREGLVELGRLLSSGALKPIIARKVQLADLADAHAMIERGVAGKMVVEFRNKEAGA